MPGIEREREHDKSQLIRTTIKLGKGGKIILEPCIATKFSAWLHHRSQIHPLFEARSSTKMLQYWGLSCFQIYAETVNKVKNILLIRIISLKYISHDPAPTIKSVLIIHQFVYWIKIPRKNTSASLNATIKYTIKWTFKNHCPMNNRQQYIHSEDYYNPELHFSQIL